MMGGCAYEDGENKIWRLSDNRMVRCEFSGPPKQRCAYVDITMFEANMEAEEIPLKLPYPHKRGVPELYGVYSKTLRVYSTEMEKLKEAINDFARYLHDRSDNTSYAEWFFKPSKALRTDQSIQGRGNYEF